MDKKKIAAIVLALILLLAAGAAAYAAGNYGSAEDPLVAKSYLDTVLRPALEKELRQELDAAVSEMRSGSGEFTVLNLNKGQSVTCEVGCELLPRLGSVKAMGAASPALVDTTTGNSVSSGSVLTANHLYMVTIAGNGFTAAENNTYVLVSGGYVVG